MGKNQSGFAHQIIILLIVVLAVVAFVIFRIQQANNSTTNPDTSQSTSKDPTIKNIGIRLDYYNPTTNKAGDVVFKKFNFDAGGLDAIFNEYGRLNQANSAAPARRNPQPTFLAPLGTHVYSLVDGTVVNVPQLYSGDYSIHVQSPGSDLIFETEHVQNVRVKVGDKVKAGDVVAEVSNYDAANIAGLGLVEIGVLIGGDSPAHACPFAYLDNSIKEDTLKKITALEDSWEQFVGDPDVFDQQSEPIPGCAILDRVEG